MEPDRTVVYQERFCLAQRTIIHMLAGTALGSAGLLKRFLCNGCLIAYYF